MIRVRELIDALADADPLAFVFDVAGVVDHHDGTLTLVAALTCSDCDAPLHGEGYCWSCAQCDHPGVYCAACEDELDDTSQGVYCESCAREPVAQTVAPGPYL